MSRDLVVVSGRGWVLATCCADFQQEVLEWNIDEISFGDTDVATVTNEGEADTIPKS